MRRLFINSKDDKTKILSNSTTPTIQIIFTIPNWQKSIQMAEKNAYKNKEFCTSQPVSFYIYT